MAEMAELRYVHPRIVSGMSADLALAVAAARELAKTDHLVLASGDGDFVPLVEAAKHAGVTIGSLRAYVLVLKLR